MNVDARGVTRGCCNVQGCSCSGYAGTSTGGLACDKCGHPPPKHARLSMTVPTFPVDSDQESSLGSGSENDSIITSIIKTIADYFPFLNRNPPPQDARQDARPSPIPTRIEERRDPLPQPLIPSYAQPHPSQPLPLYHLQPQSQLLPAAPLPAITPLLPDGIRCKYPHCNKRRYQEDSGKMHEFCGRFHATEFAKLGNQDGAAAVPAGMKCKTPNCTRSRRAHEDGNGYYDYCGKRCRDGSYTTSQSAFGKPCSLPGCNKPKYVDPVNGRMHDYCGRTHANHAQAAGIAPPVCTIKPLSSLEEAVVEAHFKKEWASEKGPCPDIKFVFQVTNLGLEKRWNAYKQRLPSHLQTEEKYFHGTKLTCDIANTCAVCSDKSCGICGISKLGMYRECIRKNINFQRFGHGFYFAPNSSKCHDYTQGIQTHRAMLLVDILPGKKHVILTTNQKLRGPPDGCHSVFGKPAAGQLNYPELVVYNPDCVMPRYIIVYVSNGVHKIAK